MRSSSCPPLDRAGRPVRGRPGAARPAMSAVVALAGSLTAPSSSSLASQSASTVPHNRFPQPRTPCRPLPTSTSSRRAPTVSLAILRRTTPASRTSLPHLLSRGGCGPRPLRHSSASTWRPSSRAASGTTCSCTSPASASCSRSLPLCLRSTDPDARRARSNWQQAFIEVNDNVASLRHARTPMPPLEFAVDGRTLAKIECVASVFSRSLSLFRHLC